VFHRLGSRLGPRGVAAEPVGDLVLELDGAGIPDIVSACGPGYAIVDPIQYDGFVMASIIDRTTAEKADLILHPAGPSRHR
jgi:hypothetical protein